MKRQFSACQTPRSMYPSIFNSFPVIRTASAKNRSFHVPQPTFVSPGDAPATITQYLAWIEWQFNSCQSPRSVYLSIFNSFRVIRCLIQCVTKKIRYFYHIFVSPGDAPGQSRKTLHKWKDNSVLSKTLAACTIHIQQFPSYLNCKCKKSPFSCTAAHIIVSPGDYHAICSMDGKTIQCFQTPRSMYLSIFNSFWVIQCLIQCASPKSLFLTHFCFPWGRPWGNHANVVSTEREFDAYKLSRWMYPSNYNRFWDRARYWSKIVIFHTPLAFDALVGISPLR